MLECFTEIIILVLNMNMPKNPIFHPIRTEISPKWIKKAIMNLKDPRFDLLSERRK